MVMNKQSAQRLRFLVTLALVQISSLFKISFIIGSHTAFFSGTSIAIPMVGAFLGPLGVVLLFLTRCSAQWLVQGAYAWHSFAFVLPGLCASLYWSTTTSLIRVWLPLACMIAFVVHPVGRDAFPYALYWTIPVAIYYAQCTHIVFKALGATFVAHAVGSVIWLYTVCMTPSLWLALIPVVAIERAVCMMGMLSIWYAYHWIGYRSASLSVRVQPCVRA